jgi:O-antigen/teichoic acid export membrane protein
MESYVNRDIVIVTSGRILQLIITMVSVRVFTALLSTGEVGNIYLINSLFGFFGLALINPVGMYMNRKMHQWTVEKIILNRFSVFNIYLLFLAISSTVVVYLLNRFWQVGGSIELNMLMLLLMLSIYFTTWNQLIIPTLNLLNYRMSFVLFNLLTLAGGLGLSILFVKITSTTAVSWLGGQLAAQMLITLFALAYFRRVVGGKVLFSEARRVMTRENFIHVLHFVFPLGCTTFFMWMQNQSYRIIIEKTVGAEFLGLIGLGIGVASSIAVAAESLIQQLYLPGFYRDINTSDEDKRAEAWNAMAQLTIPVYIALTIMVSCLAPFLVHILASEKFGGAYLFVIFGAWIEFFRMTTYTLTSVAHAEMRTKYLLRGYCAGGLIALVGTYLGAQTTVYALLIPALLVVSGLVSMIIMYRDMKKLMRIKVGISNIRRSILLSLPFALALPFFTQHPTLLLSLLLVGFGGSYFLLTQYLLTRPLLKERVL